MLIRKIKSKLGLCDSKWCIKKAVFDYEIPCINHKGQLCEQHMEYLDSMNVFNSKEVK